MRRDVLLIFKEAVNNAARHSDCSQIEIKFRVENSRLLLQIKDNGTGFAPDSEIDGQGLRSMSRRAHAPGGKLTIDLQRRKRLSIKNHAAGASARSVTRSRYGRFAGVAAHRRARRQSVSQISPARPRRLSFNAAGNFAIEIFNRRTSQKNRRQRDEYFVSHGFVSSQKHLRKIAGSLKNRSRRQGSARKNSLIIPALFAASMV